MRTTVVFVLVLMMVLPYLGTAKGRGRGSKWWGIARAGEPNNLVSNSIKENSITNSYLDPDVHATLRRKQRRLVRDHPGVVVAVAKGAKQAISECKHQFKNRRWNCPTKDFHRGRNLFGKIVDRGKVSADSSLCSRLSLAWETTKKPHKNKGNLKPIPT